MDFACSDSREINEQKETTAERRKIWTVKQEALKREVGRCGF